MSDQFVPGISNYLIVKERSIGLANYLSSAMNRVEQTGQAKF
jgi:hypothetical protein